MSSSEKKRKKMKATNKKPKPTPQSNPLPYDLLLTCLALVSRFHYPTLSLVSKSFRSLIASPELYKTRSLLGRTESCLYVCFRYLGEYIWFTFRPEPNQTLTNDTSKKAISSGYVLATLSFPHSPPANVWDLVAVGSNIYKIGTSDIYGERSCRVSILDCQSHTWHEGPSLRVDLKNLSASVLDEKIYVAGRYKDVGSSSFKNSFNVFDTKTQTWDPNPIPCIETLGTFNNTSACIDGKFYSKAWTEVVAYNPKERRWDMVEHNMWNYMVSESFCVIENVLYFVSHNRVHNAFTWYDTEENVWRVLKGLVGLPMFPNGAYARIGDYGGKMAVLWEERLPGGGPLVADMKMVWCAVIELERRNSCEIWGTVEWFDHVLTIPSSYYFLKVVAATV